MAAKKPAKGKAKKPTKGPKPKLLVKKGKPAEEKSTGGLHSGPPGLDRR